MTTNILPGFDDAITPEQPTGIMPKRRWRFQFKFWLDANSERDKPIGEYLEAEKSRRKMTATIRDGVRLIQSLRNRDTSVLLELFPWIRDAFQPETPGDGMNALLQKIAADTEALVAGVENGKVISQETAGKSYNLQVSDPPAPPETPPSKHNIVTLAPGPRPLAVPQFAAPEPDIDDDDTLLLALRPDANAGKQAAVNFVASMNALVST